MSLDLMKAVKSSFLIANYCVLMQYLRQFSDCLMAVLASLIISVLEWESLKPRYFKLFSIGTPRNFFTFLRSCSLVIMHDFEKDWSQNRILCEGSKILIEGISDLIGLWKRLQYRLQMPWASLSQCSPWVLAWSWVSGAGTYWTGEGIRFCPGRHLTGLNGAAVELKCGSYE